MTTKILYHDLPQAPGTALTASALRKGRRLIRSAKLVGAAVNAACVFLCGICCLVSIAILAMIALGG